MLLRRARFIAYGLTVLVSACSWVRGAPAPGSAALLEKGPYLQALTSTAVEIRWQGRDRTFGAVEWGTDPGRLERTEAARVLPFSPTYRSVTPEEMVEEEVWLQRATLTGLTADTQYHYRVRQGRDLTETFTFRTPPAKPETFRFVVYGDTRSDPEAHRRVARAIWTERPDFIVNTGDLVALGDHWPLWNEEFFGPLHPLTAEVPMWVVRGNHEQSGRALKPLFHIPARDGEFYYRFDYGPARFLCLDSYASRPAMFAWLETQLRARPRATWTFLVVHEPPFPGAGSRGYGRGFERERLVLLCQQYGVDLIFTGHDHGYMRTVPVLAYQALPGQPVTQIITAGGGAPLHSSAHGVHIAAARRAYNYCRVEIDGRKLTATAIDPDSGDSFDHLSLEKDAQGRFIAPADYRASATDLAEINALESLRRSLTGFSLKAINAGDQVPLESEVFNPYPGPIEVTVTFRGKAAWWEAPAPVTLTIPPRGVVPFCMTARAKVSFANEANVAYLTADYVLWDGRKGTLRGEGLSAAPAPATRPAAPREPVPVLQED